MYNPLGLSDIKIKLTIYNQLPDPNRKPPQQKYRVRRIERQSNMYNLLGLSDINIKLAIYTQPPDPNRKPPQQNIE